MDGLMLTVDRSKADIEERLDRLIGEIKELQKPYMESGGNGDIVLVRIPLILPIN